MFSFECTEKNNRFTCKRKTEIGSQNIKILYEEFIAPWIFMTLQIFVYIGQELFTKLLSASLRDQSLPARNQRSLFRALDWLYQPQYQRQYPLVKELIGSSMHQEIGFHSTNCRQNDLIKRNLKLECSNKQISRDCVSLLPQYICMQLS